MANNNIEQYLEAMLAALDGDTVPDVPSPSWNIEKYLAAILTKLSSGGGSGGGSSGGGDVVVSNITVDVSGDEPVYSCDMTESEITAAIGDGKTVLAVLGGGAAISVWSDFLLVDFNFINRPTSTLQFMRFMYDQGSFIKQREVAYTLTPAT